MVKMMFPEGYPSLNDYMSYATLKYMADNQFKFKQKHGYCLYSKRLRGCVYIELHPDVIHVGIAGTQQFPDDPKFEKCYLRDSTEYTILVEGKYDEILKDVDSCNKLEHWLSHDLCHLIYGLIIVKN